MPKKIVFGFLIIILIGAVLLSMPFSSKSGQSTPFLHCVFTATSATCVTGLIVYDTYSHWSAAGQGIILCLIQIGGIGFMSIITMLSIFLKRKISLKERILIMQSSGGVRLSGAVLLIKRIIIGTVFFEGVGAIALATRFCPKMGFWQGIYNAVFHSISAFCNAGFDLMGKYGEFSSLTTFKGDWVVNITIMSLIIIGGIGFIVWSDFAKWKFKFKKYELHSKIVLTVTAVLIALPAVLFMIFENISPMEAFFHSVTLRTAGFNTIDLSALSESGNALSIMLMAIGGSPGSTAGGIKTTTFVVLILSAVASTRQSGSITVFKRRIEGEQVRQAAAVLSIFTALTFTASLIMCHFEPYSLTDILFEAVSAAGTVGLTKGITPLLSPISHIILIILMFAGRVGGITLMLTLARQKNDALSTRPVEKILIG